MSLFSLSPRWAIAFALVGTIALSLTGCQPSQQLFPVQGKVMLDNQPLKAGMVTYVPEAAKDNSKAASPSGQIQSDGTYTLMTNGKSGAPAGKYKVVITTNTPGMGAPAEVDASKPQLTPLNPQGQGPQVNEKYKSASTTDLTKEVSATASAGAYDVKVSP